MNDLLLLLARSNAVYCAWHRRPESPSTLFITVNTVGDPLFSVPSFTTVCKCLLSTAESHWCDRSSVSTGKFTFRWSGSTESRREKISIPTSYCRFFGSISPPLVFVGFLFSYRLTWCHGVGSIPVKDRQWGHQGSPSPALRELSPAPRKQQIHFFFNRP